MLGELPSTVSMNRETAEPFGNRLFEGFFIQSSIHTNQLGVLTRSHRNPLTLRLGFESILLLFCPLFPKEATVKGIY